jgi:hypothetical protein
MPKFIEIWTPGNTAYWGQFCPTFISLDDIPWFLQDKWCQINWWMALNVISFLPCVAAIIKPWHGVFRVTPWIHNTQCPIVKWRVACSTRWVPDTSCTKTCGQFIPWDMVTWASSVFGIPHSWRAQVNHVLLLSLSPFSTGHTSLRKLPHKAVAPSSRFFHWLDWLP